MPVEVSMPQLGESIAEGTLVKWHKKVGDWIERDETLFEISTDKVDTEIPSPAEGYIERILVKEGETVAVHTVVCWIKEASARDEKARKAPEAPSTAALADSAPSGLPGAEEVAPTGAEADAKQQDRHSPLVRRLAAEHGVDLSRVKGSGAAGRVTKEDLFRHVEQQKAAPAGRTASARQREEKEIALEDRIEPMSAMRQQISDHMLLSRRTSAHVTTIFEVDMTAVRDLKSWLSSRFEERHNTRLTYLPFIMYAVCRGLRKFPIVNASLEDKNVHFHGHVNLGVAVSLDNGLVVPVIRDAERKDILGLARALNDLARRARSKQLDPKDVQGGTFTITNPGVFGSLIGTPIIHQPQVAILCVGTIQKRPVVLPGSDAIAIRSMAYFTLTFDHRLIDGAVADRFLSDVKATIESANFEGVYGEHNPGQP